MTITTMSDSSCSTAGPFRLQRRNIISVFTIVAFIISIASALTPAEHFIQRSQAAPWPRSIKSKADGFVRNKRLAVPGKVKHLSSKKYQECIAPGSKPGHCKHLSACGDETYRSNFPRLMDYMCVIENEFIGVCCPDDVLPADGQNDILPVGGLAGSLPAIAKAASGVEGDDKETSKESEGSSQGSQIGRDQRASRGCGVSSRDQSRVTGGRPTSSREWPWVAALLRSGEQYCGGVLITDRHVLTAAHCVHRRKPREIMIRLGEYDLRYPNETRALDFKVVEIRIHNGYVPTTYKHDIAIIKIHRPTIFNTYIWPVCLPPVGANFENKQATVIGWGTTSFGGAGSYVLMEVNVPVWPLAECTDKFTQEITENHICAGVYTGNGDACQGDSGGPLLHQLGNGRWVSVGVVSWGIGCGEPNKPGIYTNVSRYLDWIFANSIF